MENLRFTLYVWVSPGQFSKLAKFLSESIKILKPFDCGVLLGFVNFLVG
tara:strand:- start:143 stop:289 length:147 start_codon:yes stop_codon:yes gene_type:complete